MSSLLEQEYYNFYLINNVHEQIMARYRKSPLHVVGLVEKWLVARRNKFVQYEVLEGLLNRKDNKLTELGLKHRTERIVNLVKKLETEKKRVIFTNRLRLTILPHGLYFGKVHYKGVNLPRLREMAADERIIMCALRYYSRSSTTDLAVSLHWYKAYLADARSEGLIFVEGFASPIDSQVIRMGEGYYCSLHEDTDSYFGSLGSFFEQDFEGCYVVANPIFTEEFLDKAVDKIIHECTTKEHCKFILYTPDWSDASFYKKLTDSGCIELLERLPRGEHFFEDLKKDPPSQTQSMLDTLVFHLRPKKNIVPIEFDFTVRSSD